MTTDALVFDNVTICYHKTPAVHHLSATIAGGALTALMGPNGAGKSTLMRAALGLLPLTTGRITIGGVDSTACRRRIAWLPQRSTIDWDFPLTIREVVAQGRYPALGWWRGFAAADHQAVDAALDELGLTRLADRPIAALSGGQQQRVLLARALASGADILLLDEPFNGLDAPASADLVKRLKGWAASGRLVLTAIHDLALARQVCDEALVIRTHLVSCGPVVTALTPLALAEAFGDTLIDVPAVHVHHDHAHHDHGTEHQP